MLGEYFVTSFLAYKRNEIERFERYVTDWEFASTPITFDYSPP